MKRRKELLRKQMELLAEQSVAATEGDLYRLTVAMCETNRELERAEAEEKHAHYKLPVVTLLVNCLTLVMQLLILLTR